MSDRNMDVVSGARAPVLASALLARIRELNRDYVELMLAERAVPSPGAAMETLSPRLLDALAALDEPARDALSRCPFTLFSLAFDDARFWHTVLGDTATMTGDSVEVRYGALSTAPMQAAFGEIALFTAVHTAHANRIAARVLFGLPDGVATILIEAALWRVRRVAIDYPGLVMPRWPANPAFWPDLIRFAAEGDDLRLETARLLGSQLIAAELNGTAPRGRRRFAARAR
jgi:hypothetical protein